MTTLKKRATILLIFLSAIATLLITPLLLDAWRMSHLPSWAKAVRIGDSKTRVENLLGQPSGQFARGSGLLDGALFGLIPKTPEQWAYGSRYEYQLSEFPFVWRYRWRLFGPDADDVVIQFDRNGKVSAVIDPGAPSSQPAPQTTRPSGARQSRRPLTTQRS